MEEHHLVLDALTLLALRGNKQVSGLVHYAHADEFRDCGFRCWRWWTRTPASRGSLSMCGSWRC